MEKTCNELLNYKSIEAGTEWMGRCVRTGNERYRAFKQRLTDDSQAAQTRDAWASQSQSIQNDSFIIIKLVSTA